MIKIGRNLKFLFLLLFCFVILIGYKNNIYAAENSSENKMQFDLDLKNGTVAVKAE